MRSQKAIRGGKRALVRPLRQKKAQRPKCPVSGKIGYPAQVEAVSALAVIQTRHADEDRRKPVRAYKCPDCDLWHLTSRP